MFDDDPGRASPEEPLPDAEEDFADEHSPSPTDPANMPPDRFDEGDENQGKPTEV